jgi:hypothetical protein
MRGLPSECLAALIPEIIPYRKQKEKKSKPSYNYSPKEKNNVAFYARNNKKYITNK